MQGTSRDSLAATAKRLDVLIDSGADPAVLAADLFSVVRLLDREISLRRVLSDPARPGEQKAEFVRSLLGGQISGDAVDLVSNMVSLRWSKPRDLADATEIAAVYSEVAVAERDGTIDDLEDALFRFGRIVEGQPELRAALTDPSVSAQRRVELVRSLLDGKVTPVTERLMIQLVSGPRGRTLEQGLEEYARYVAERHQRLVAVVRVTFPLTDEQKSRLAAILRRIYGFEVHLNIEIDPEVVGGISVRVGDEIIDGTIASRLDEARRHLAS